MFYTIKYIDCVDDQNGYAGYGCGDNQGYCGDSGIWYDKFRAACRKTCGTCLGKQYTIHHNLYLLLIMNSFLC